MDVKVTINYITNPFRNDSVVLNQVMKYSCGTLLQIDFTGHFNNNLVCGLLLKSSPTALITIENSAQLSILANQKDRLIKLMF